jgi:uncharacterized membrane protein HdeD (DUF308 family)
MKEFFKRIKADYLVSSILCVVLGIVFIVEREATINMIGTLLAIIMIVIGAVYLCSFFLNIVTNGLSAAIGAVVLLLGIWVLIQPGIIMSLIPIVIGVLLLAHGIRGMKEAWASKQFGYGAWGISAAFSVISLVLGIICIVDAFGVLELASVAIGIALIYNGLSNIWIAFQSTKAERSYRRGNETIDVSFKEDSEE